MPALVLLATAYTGGTIAAALFAGPWWATIGLAAALATAVRLAGWRASAALLVAAVALAGAGHVRLVEGERGLGSALAGHTGTHLVEGVVREDASVRGAFARFDLAVERLDGLPVAGGVRVSIRASEAVPAAGDRLRMLGDLEAPPQLEAFDYPGYLRSRGIEAVLGFPERLEVLALDTGAAATRALRDLRRGGVANIERALPEPEAALAAGMLIGERGTIPASLREDLRVTGTSHLVVVSGQNIALLLGVGVALLTAILSRRHAALLALALLPGYVVLVGAEPPVVRAAIMAVGLVLASAGGRRTPAWVYLAYAVALMLAVEPSLVRDVAFQLSATATAGVMLLAPPLRDAALAITRRRAEGVAAAFVEAAATATGAALAVLPVQIGAFGEFSLLTVPANVLAAPLYEATVVVAAAAAALGWWDPAAELVGGAGRYVPRAFIAEVSLLARLPGARVPIEAPIAAGAAVYAALAAGAWLLDRRIERPALAGGGGARFALTAGLAIAAGGLWYGVLTPVDRLASVTVLDVGQGLAVLVQDARERVLIDAGPPDGAVLAALGAARLSGQLAAVVVTHDDADHAGGVPEVVRRLDAARVLAGGELEAAGTPLERIDIGDRIHLGRRTTIEVLSPPVATPLRAHASDNDGSLVLLVTIGSRRVLVAADIEVGAESWLVASGLDLRADALIVPHHGSNSSSSAEFIAAVAPRLAVISAGAGNSFGHPHPAVLERYAAASAEVLRTDLDGSVTLRSDGESLWVGNER